MTTASGRHDTDGRRSGDDGRAVREFVAAPKEFLRSNMVLLRMADGMRARSASGPGGSGDAGSSTVAREMDHAAFLRWMDKQNRHWFTLTARTAPGDGPGSTGYVLTPAVEKYAEAFPGDPTLGALLQGHSLPPVGPAEDYIPAHYVPYLQGSSANPEQNVGHTVVPLVSSADFRADFVFTAAMNGCALAVTKEGERDDFTAWHYQSPSSNRAAAEQFRSEAGPVDWFGDGEYQSLRLEAIPESTNLLWRGGQGWEFLSQENHADFRNYGDVRTHGTTSRPVRLEPGEEWRYVARHYLRTVEEHLETLRRVERDYVAKLGGSTADLLLKSSFDLLKMRTERDVRSLRGVGDARQLAQTAVEIRNDHEGTRRVMAHFDDQRVKAEENTPKATSWFRRPAKGTRPEAQSRRAKVSGFVSRLSDDAWISALTREAHALTTRAAPSRPSSAQAAPAQSIADAARRQVHGTQQSPTSQPPRSPTAPWAGSGAAVGKSRTRGL
ncbi:hypothetical protein ABZX30_15075 [Streptomyces sp. NPDC004542]|uniref:hypothetical protein n=1 Tax=Streptomyces sp. NPDC004542 TaxID=3154281 RepID=UPI0033AB5691